MHSRLRRFGRDWLAVAQLERLCRLHPKSLGPGLGPHTPGRRTRAIFHRPRSVAPDMDDLDHPALAELGITSPWRADDMALFDVRGLELLPPSGGENAICF